MTNLPVESMKTGGLYWFTDLTVPDCYLILPAITCLTVLTTIEVSSTFYKEPKKQPVRNRVYVEACYKLKKKCYQDAL